MSTGCRRRARSGSAMGSCDPWRGTTEYMASSYFSVRGSLEAQLSGNPSLQSARAGAGLHLLPYRRIDVGFFIEGGPSYGVLTGFRPVVVGGMSFSAGLSTLLFF